MCCFSRPVRYVAATEIFARGTARGQYLVYKMSVELEEDTAMVLPLPVPPSPTEDAVRFVDLSGYDDFFLDLGKGFPAEVTRGMGAFAPQAMSRLAPTLKVHSVGDFEASFVPAIADFARLDERFRLPSGVWDALPSYRDFGFAVFKLRGGARGLLASFRKAAGGRKSFHPMAFEFPRRDPSRLFFPTVHVHDGEVHETATFDHTLYLQGEGAGWESSAEPAKSFVRCERAKDIVDPDAHVHRRMLRGPGPNRDTLV
jgi:hypothetical protein